jgi:ADP-ribosylglycohydrolase
MKINEHSLPVIGAILGDIVGSRFELNGTRIKTVEFDFFNIDSHFTDDTVLTLAIAKWLLEPNNNLIDIVLSLGRQYIDVGFGHSFKNWLRSPAPQPYNSYGNGSAMRVSAIGSTASTISEVMSLAKDSAIITHNHEEGIKGAQAVATAIFLAYNSFPKVCIKEYIEEKFDYNLNRSISVIRNNYDFDSSCQGSVPEAIIAFLESTDVEDSIRLAVSLGGDADTQASIAGAISAAYYKYIPNNYIDMAFAKLPEDLLSILEMFNDNIPSISTSSYYVLTAKRTISIRSNIRYTFALAVTDTTEIIIPKGTKLMIKWHKGNCSECNLLSNKQSVFEMIEKRLEEKYGENERPLCNGIQIQVTQSDLLNFSIREAEMDDMLDLL